MSREKTLVKNTAIVAVGQICTKFITFFMLPFYTALLSAQEFGVVDLLQTFITLLTPIFFWQLDQAIFRFLIDAREKETEKKKLFTSTMTVFLLQTIAYLVIFFIVSLFIKNEYKYFLATNVVVTMLASLLLQTCRGLGDNLTYSLGSIVTGSGTVILNVVFIAGLKWGAYGMLAASLISNILCSLFIFFKKKLYLMINKKYYSKETIKKMLKYSVPLIPNQLSWWVVSVSDRTIISLVLGVAVNGIYSAVNKFSSIIITAFNIFNITWTESAAIHFKDKDSSEYFTNIFNTSIKLFTCVCFGVIAFMPFVFNLMIVRSEYASGYYQIPILILSTLFTIVVSLLGSIYVALKKSNEIAKTSVFAAIINIIVNVGLIKFIGLYAASVSTLVAYLSMSIYRYVDVQKYIKLKLNIKFILSSLLIALIIIPIYYVKNTLLCVVGLIIVVVYSIYNCFDLFKVILNTVMKKVKKNK